MSRIDGCEVSKSSYLYLPRALWHAAVFAGICVCLGMTVPLASAQEANAQGGAGSPGKTVHAYLDLRRARAPTGDIEAGRGKAQLCSICHGPTGAVAVAPMIPILAGQSYDYLYWELMEYKRGTLTDSPMTALTADINEQDIRDLASFYASQKQEPKPVDADAVPPDPKLLAYGEQLYLHGAPDKGIPPCQGCHGADARGTTAGRGSGHAAYAIYPSLRGQHGAYLQARLVTFSEGKMQDSTNDFVMAGVGARLDKESIDALSAWLSSLPP